MTFQLHPFGDPIVIAGRVFELPTFTDPEHARYAMGLVQRLLAHAALTPAATQAAAESGFEAVTDCLWRVAMHADGVCPLLAGLLVDVDVAWSIDVATEATDFLRGALARGELATLRGAFLPAIGNLFMQERAIAALLERADPARRYHFPSHR
jgi:hypothetical protein